MEQPIFFPFTYQTDLYLPRKFKGGIGCDSHLAITYGELSYGSSTILVAKLACNFVQHVLPFLLDLNHTQI